MPQVSSAELDDEAPQVDPRIIARHRKLQTRFARLRSIQERSAPWWQVLWLMLTALSPEFLTRRRLRRYLRNHRQHVRQLLKTRAA